MLERTAGCLESGSLRRILPGSRTSLKSRRMLHSTFWSHGAAEIEFSSLWASLLSGSDSTSQQCNIQQSNHTGGGVLLDFLYPAGTLSLIKHYSGWGVDRSDNRRGRVGMGRLGHRLYTSSAIDATFNEDAGVQYDPQIQAIPMDLSDERSVVEVLGLKGNNDYIEAWEQYLLLNDVVRRRVRIGLIHYLSRSNRILEAERVVELFKSMPEEHRNLDSVSAAMQSYLRLRDLANATKLHEKILFKYKSLIGTDHLMAYLVGNSSWSRAFELHRQVKQYRLSFPGPDFKVFDIMRALPNLHVLAGQLAQHVDKLLQETSDTSTTEWKSFASKIIRHAVFCPAYDPVRFQTFMETLSRWKSDLSGTYHQGLKHLLDSDQSKAAIRLFRRSREVFDIRTNKNTLLSMLEIFCSHHSVLGMQQVLDDFFRFHGTPPLDAYRLCLAEFASLGDADTVHALFKQMLPRLGGKHFTTNDIVPLLNVHAKRGELSEVIKHFNEIQSKYYVEPNLRCWNILIHAHGKVNDVEGAFACFEKLLATAQITPDQYTFGTLMGICVSNGDLDRTLDVFRLAGSLKVPPNNAMLGCLVLAYTQDNHLDKAEKICEQGLSSKLDPSSTRMWNYLIVGHAMRRDLSNVNRIFQRMSEVNVEYDTYTYSALMQSLAMVGQPEGAYTILKEVMKEAGCRATSFHYAIVMGGFIATHQYERVFDVYNRMSRRNVTKSASSSLQILKASFKVDNQPLEKESAEQQGNRAFKLFEEIVSSMSPQDNASTTWYGAGRMPHNIAYSTMVSSYVSFVLAQRNENVAVKQIYQKYLELLPKENSAIRPISMLSALMISRHREGDFDGIQECWDLALAEAKRQGRRLQGVFDTSTWNNIIGEIPDTVSKVVYNRQLELRVILTTYMDFLAKQRRIDDLISVVKEVLGEGFILTNQNWNQYISLLARHLRIQKAFMLCEEVLMPGWTGWARLRWRLPERNRLPLEQRNLKKDLRHYRPRTYTFLYLTKAWLELQASSAESKETQALIVELERDCPKTVEAIKTMQRVDDELEREIIG